MKELLFKAYDRSGTLVTGKAQGSDEKQVLSQMQRKGLYVVELKAPQKNTLAPMNSLKWFQRVKQEDLIIFTRQFYTLFKAGLSTDLLLNTLIKQTQNEALKNSIVQISDGVQSGLSLAQAFSLHPKIFNKLYVSMLIAGEEAGILEEVLLELTRVLEKENQIHKEVSSATFYPKIVLFALCGSVYAMLTMVLPKFSAFYAKYDATLPLPTRILMRASEIANQYWMFVLAAFATIGFLIYRYVKSPAGKIRFDELKLRLPIFGMLHQKIAMARFGHVFSSLCRSGLPMVQSLEVVSGIIGNEIYYLEIQRIREGVLQGKSLAEMMHETKHFPPIVVETTAVGEKTGNLDEMLTALAGHFELEVQHTTKNLVTLLEPILLGGIFGVVTLMALAVFLPMWNLSSVVMKH